MIIKSISVTPITSAVCGCFRVVDVGTEWRTFSNEKNTKDPSRVGAAEVGKHECFTAYLPFLIVL